jgi:PTS system N-acetylglucosamine-specific IIC component
MVAMKFTGLQQLGRALMLPIAVLPVAGLLLRLGQPDLLDIPFVAAAGDAIFSNLGLLFAVGVAVGFASENHGAAGLAGLVCYVVATKGAEVLMMVPDAVLADVAEAGRTAAAAAWKAKAITRMSVPVGILSGLIAGFLYNRYHSIRLPEYLAFFGGRRFVPIVTGFAALFLAAIFGAGWPWLSQGLDTLSSSILGAGNFGLFCYGVLNRLLIVTGLHHVINNIAWFIIGDYHGVTGDLKRFFAGDPTAGSFMAGFFPVMMFGLPGACLAIYQSAPKQRRALVAGVLISLALTSFLTGVTEPIEFSFMFLAPALYAIHAVLTGVAMVVMNVLDVKLGFGFSAGLFDYALNFTKATNPLLLIPVGVVYFLIYCGLFRFVIARFDIKTMGREDATEADDAAPTGLPPAPQPAFPAPAPSGRNATAVGILEALGGVRNLREVEACITRLRCVVVSSAGIDEPRLRTLGARGVIKPSAESVQVVLGPAAELMADEIRTLLPTTAR